MMLILKGLQGAEIKVMDGNDRKTDVSQEKEILHPGRVRKTGCLRKKRVLITRVTKNRQGDYVVTVLWKELQY
jgi:hypothetical protein